jgi:hypothetical protein
MRKLLRFLKSKTFKYLLVFVVFIVAMFTSNVHNIQTRIQNTITIRELKQEIELYRAKSRQNQERLQQLKSDKEDLEKFAEGLQEVVDYIKTKCLKGEGADGNFTEVNFEEL